VNEDLKQKIIVALKTIYDPEMPVNIYDLGIIYNIDITENNDVFIKMTLTTPNCSEAQSIPVLVHEAVSGLNDVRSVNVEIVWDPPWDTSRMSDVARMILNMVY